MNPSIVQGKGPFVFFYCVDLYRGVFVEDISQYYHEINQNIKYTGANVLIIDILDRVEYTACGF